MRYYLFFFILVFFEFGFCQNILPDASFRSISTANNIFLVSGSQGNILKADLMGSSWENISPKGYEKLDFRSSCILSKNEFIAVSAGEAEKGQAIMIKTKDAGKSWYKVFESSEKGVFLDGLKFNSSGIGFVIGDAIDEKPYLLISKNYGESWQRLEKAFLPDVEKGDASYAASNSSIQIIKKNVWFVTQNKIFYSKNLGKDWQVYKTPFIKSSSSGIFGINFINKNLGIVVGGDYLDKEKATLQYALTENGGKSLIVNPTSVSVGLSESACFLNTKTIIKVSLEGTKITKDLCKTWKDIDKIPLHAVACSGNRCIGVGGRGNLAVYDF